MSLDIVLTIKCCSLPEESSCQLSWDWVLFSRIGWFMCQTTCLPLVQILSVKKLLKSRKSLICLLRSFKYKNPSSLCNSTHWIALPSSIFSSSLTENTVAGFLIGASGGAKRTKIRSLIFRHLSLRAPLQIVRNQSRKLWVHNKGKKLWPRELLLTGDQHFQHH